MDKVVEREEFLNKVIKDENIDNNLYIGCRFESVIFDNVYGKDVIFKNCVFINCTFYNISSYSNEWSFETCNFESLFVNRVILDNVLVSNCYFNKLLMQKCIVTKVNLDKTTVDIAELITSVLNDSNFFRYNFNTITLFDVYFDRCKFDYLNGVSNDIKYLTTDGTTENSVSSVNTHVNNKSNYKGCISCALNTLKRFLKTALNYIDTKLS